MALALIGTLGTTELMVILFLALLMFGGRLPDVARSMGRSVNQFKRGLKDIDDNMNRDDKPAYVPPPSLPRSTMTPAAGEPAQSASTTAAPATTPTATTPPSE